MWFTTLDYLMEQHNQNNWGNVTAWDHHCFFKPFSYYIEKQKQKDFAIVITFLSHKHYFLRSPWATNYIVAKVYINRLRRSSEPAANHLIFSPNISLSITMFQPAASVILLFFVNVRGTQEFHENNWIMQVCTSRYL